MQLSWMTVNVTLSRTAGTVYFWKAHMFTIRKKGLKPRLYLRIHSDTIVLSSLLPSQLLTTKIAKLKITIAQLLLYYY